MYAISLASGKSVTIGNTSGGNTAVTYTAGASALTVVLNAQQYYLLPRATDLTTGVVSYTDISVFTQNVMDLPIPTTAGIIVAGRVQYLGCSVQAGAATNFQIQDDKGSYNGTTYSAQTIQEVDLAAAGTFEYFYPISESANGRMVGGIRVNGNLTVASITGTPTGIVRIATG